jgi:hypothetical protein
MQGRQRRLAPAAIVESPKWKRPDMMFMPARKGRGKPQSNLYNTMADP